MQARLGEFDFDLLNYQGFQQLQHSFEFKFKENKTVDGTPTVQTSQAVNEKLSLSGVLYNAAVNQRETLQQIAKTKQPQRFATGDGVYWGQFLIKTLGFDLQFFNATGQPIKAGFQISLEKYKPSTQAVKQLNIYGVGAARSDYADYANLRQTNLPQRIIQSDYAAYAKPKQNNNPPPSAEPTGLAAAEVEYGKNVDVSDPNYKRRWG